MKLTESQLRNIVRSSISKILKESFDFDDDEPIKVNSRDDWDKDEREFDVDDDDVEFGCDDDSVDFGVDVDEPEVAVMDKKATGDKKKERLFQIFRGMRKNAGKSDDEIWAEINKAKYGNGKGTEGRYVSDKYSTFLDI